MSNSPVQKTPDRNVEQCKICFKEFPRYDQRGFKNAGFSAHQNRCVERDQSKKEPSPEQPSPKKPRMLLPASISPSSSMPTTDELLNTPNVAIDRSITLSTSSVFQITQCEYCTPESGLHNPSCPEIESIVSTSPVL
ncbi:hypothetical protein [Parasitella parasitica]|uniref:Uncharacterized protein n=1 Tax=Parasitella parasitica TaxID=35722 RepID=A0A0B7MXP1_9FUNG|nr:hypothetical protein [Parasitella parasitica]